MHHQIRQTATKIDRRLALITPLVRRRRRPLAPLRFLALNGPGDRPPLAGDLDDSDWPAIAPGAAWGRPDLNFVLRGAFVIPAAFEADRPQALYLPLGDAGQFSHPEALAYLDGHPYAAVDRHHHEIRLPDELRDGRPHRLLLHGWTGTPGLGGFNDGRPLIMGECALVEIDPPTSAFLALARTALETARLLDSSHPAQARLLTALDEAFKLLATQSLTPENSVAGLIRSAPPAFYDSVPAALTRLEEGLAEAGPPLDLTLIAAGHAHLDVAWLWTLDQTRHKAARSFYNVLRLMDDFPNYHFTQSQPQLYEFVRQDFPELFAAIRERVADGRWEPIGGMWVEADCNITGPESLARQFLLGRNYFRRHFGPQAESPVLWLPDVFGYSSSLPQLIKQAGLEYFFTIKIGWNQYNRLPYDSFWWQGLDGTRVLTHFSTSPERPWQGETQPVHLMNSATYNAELSAFGALGSWQRLQQKDSQRVMLMSYGYGDGGGGPTREMNENALVLAGFPAVPQVRQGKVIDFFRRLEAESGDRLPAWQGELYLELHRGTFTSQSRSKRAHRQSEFLLHDAEFLAALAALHDPEYDYPKKTLEQAWQLLCLNQFHDIIPGSSISAVYDESLAQYEQIRALAGAARDEALAVLRRRAGGDVLLINPTSFRRDDLALWPGRLPEGQAFAGRVYSQEVEVGTLIGGLVLPPYSIQTLSTEPGPGRTPDPAAFPMIAEPRRLENAFVRLELDEAGDIVRLYDKQAGREVLAPGRVANQFQAFEDRPLHWDAWDIDIFYDDKLFLARPAERIEVVESGPLRVAVTIERRILNSQYTQRIALRYNSPQVDIETSIDWAESHTLLKVAFPVDILAPAATYEIQWGSVERPTHRNTSWDWARFESCAQKWVDLSEGGYGVALLNDCKYGHDIHENVMRLSLLRSPRSPDPGADLGRHHFAYSLLPHAGSFDPAAVAGPAYALNDPILAVTGTGGQPGSEASALASSLISGPSNVIIETIKGAEDGRGLIVRLYEANRQRGTFRLQTGFPLAGAHRCNLLEENQALLLTTEREIELRLRPFEIVTLRLIPARPGDPEAAR